ncbi:MAG TPA: hypothetical protein VHO95_13195 [Candidatus Dormibacteraeota bacterium]|nr:hypothetical protein [Candidatus Dormibacteraeota bacterium]
MLAVGGVYSYHHQYGGKQAQATVAVLDPLTSRPAGYQQAQVTFDTVVRSRQLDERVAPQINRAPDWVGSHLSVSVVTTLSGANVSPLYAVRGTAPTDAEALRLTTVAAEEARTLYIQLNTPNPADIAAALAPQIQDAQQRTDAAGMALQQFEAKNDATDLPVRIAKQRDLISNLEIAYLQAVADAAAYQVTGPYVGWQAATRRAATLQAELQVQQQELDRMTALEGQYAQLELQLSVAQGNLVSLEQLEQGEINGQQLPLTADAKIVDPAQLQSQLLWYLLTYSVGALLGLLLGASAVYGIALIKKEPQTAESVSAAFGAPILGRIPHATVATGAA